MRKKSCKFDLISLLPIPFSGTTSNTVRKGASVCDSSTNKAPFSASSFSTWTFCCECAKNRGVKPMLFTTFRSTPMLISTIIQSMLFICTARCIAVEPFLPCRVSSPPRMYTSSNTQASPRVIAAMP